MKRLALLLLIAGCSQQSTPVAQQPVAPNHHARVLSVSCSPNHGRPRVDIAVQNTGQTTIEYAKVFILFGNATNDSYLEPRPLRPGGTATATIYSPEGAGTTDCSLLSVQDGDGFNVSLTR